MLTKQKRNGQNFGRKKIFTNLILEVKSQFIVWADDRIGAKEIYFDSFEISDPPSEPDIDGEDHGEVGKNYDYEFTSTDPNGDALYFYVDWGDGSPVVEWDGPHKPGDIASISHTFETQGIFVITAKAKDIYDEESGFSQLQVNMPRDKIIEDTLFFRLIQRLIEILQNLLIN